MKSSIKDYNNKNQGVDTLSEPVKINGVILVSFEYPPRKLTKVSEVVEQLSVFLSRKKIKTTVVTFDDWRSSDIETKNRYLTIHRIPFLIPNNTSFLAMVMNLKPAFQSAIAAIYHSEKIDIIHLFEWTSIIPVIPWDNFLRIKKIYSTSSVQETRDKTRNPYNDAIFTLENMGLNIMDFILTDSKELIPIIEKNTSQKKNIEILSFSNRKYSEKTLEIYQQLKKQN